MILSVREITEPDIENLVSYWYAADPSFLTGMGVDLAKMPRREDMVKYLAEPLIKPYNEKATYCIVWLVDGMPAGHSNVNKIVFGKEAYMHLHLWKPDVRKKGMGSELVKITIPYFFNNLKLKKLYCEPYALNPAPNNTLKKAGFEFVKNYITTPGWINFEQPVNLWEMSLAKFKTIAHG